MEDDDQKTNETQNSKNKKIGYSTISIFACLGLIFIDLLSQSQPHFWGYIAIILGGIQLCPEPNSLNIFLMVTLIAVSLTVLIYFIKRDWFFQISAYLAPIVSYATLSSTINVLDKVQKIHKECKKIDLLTIVSNLINRLITKVLYLKTYIAAIWSKVWKSMAAISIASIVILFFALHPLDLQPSQNLLYALLLADGYHRYLMLEPKTPPATLL